MTTSVPPPKSSGGNSKYAIVGILLLLGASVANLFRHPRACTAAADDDPCHTARRWPTCANRADRGNADSATGRGARRGQRRVQRCGASHSLCVSHRSACPGSVDGPRVSTVVRQNYGGLRECYNRQLRSNPTLRGTVTAEWVINTNGSVGQISTAGQVAHDHTFRSCFETSLSHMRFPSPHGGCAMFRAVVQLHARRELVGCTRSACHHRGRIVSHDL